MISGSRRFVGAQASLYLVEALQETGVIGAPFSEQSSRSSIVVATEGTSPAGSCTEHP